MSVLTICVCVWDGGGGRCQGSRVELLDRRRSSWDWLTKLPSLQNGNRAGVKQPR